MQQHWLEEQHARRVRDLHHELLLVRPRLADAPLQPLLHALQPDEQLHVLQREKLVLFPREDGRLQLLAQKVGVVQRVELIGQRRQVLREGGEVARARRPAQHTQRAVELRQLYQHPDHRPHVRCCRRRGQRLKRGVQRLRLHRHSHLLQQRVVGRIGRELRGRGLARGDLSQATQQALPRPGSLGQHHVLAALDMQRRQGCQSPTLQ
mmetsp:Transcript_2786/g.9442  ORF Transcript_2786/g.9442 Transcript_2786/m.9442 type:complete len:208 (-) Transcript_2786:314-937(-)